MKRKKISLEEMIRLEETMGVILNLVPPRNDNGDIDWEIYDCPEYFQILLKEAYELKELITKEWNTLKSTRGRM